MIERVRRGLGKPNVIYVKNFICQANTGQPESQIKNCENHNSGDVKITTQEMRKSQTNNTDLNKTDFSDTDLSIYPEKAGDFPVDNFSSAGYGMDGIDRMDAYRELIKENIDYDYLLHDHPYDKERLDGFVELMAETCCSSRKSIRINQGDMSTEVVKSRFLKLDSGHIQYVMDCLDRNTTLVGNIRAYTLSALFNAPVTISQYYALHGLHIDKKLKGGQQNMKQSMDILIVEPGKAPRPAALPDNTLEAVEAALGGTAQVGCFLPQRVLMISREDAGGLAPNRCIPGGKGVVSGTFLLCGIPEEGCLFASLNPGQQKAFQELFARPGEFMMVGSEVYADPDDMADKVYSLWDTLGNGETVVLTKWGGQAQGMAV